MFGSGAHFARFGGTLPLPKIQRAEAEQKEAKGQEEQEEMRKQARGYLNKVF